MAGAQHLLRKAALERMSSPEKLDMAMRVTSPVSWVALVALGAVVVAAVAYSILGRISVKVDGSGILLRGDTVETVQVTVNGIVSSIEVQEGDLVEEGQIVARLDLRELRAEIATTEQRIADLQRQELSRQSQLASLRQAYQRQLDELYARRQSMQDLVDRQLKTKGDLQAIDAQISGVRSQMMSATISETDRTNQLAEQRRTLKQLRAKYEANSQVRSPYSGKVTAVLRPEGQVIRQGERLLNLEDPESPVHAMLFVPFAEGKKVHPGMTVRISPSTVKPEEFGFIVGQIESISSQPVTPEEVRATLNNDQLAQRFAQDTPFRVRAIPELDRATPSGFRWTSSAGPPQAISSNTPCSAQVVIGRRRPIEYVIPALKKTFGLGT